MGYERSGITTSSIGLLFDNTARALITVARPFKNRLEVLKMLLRAGASLDNCKAGSVIHGPAPKDAEWCIQKAEIAQSALAVNADWVAMKAIVAAMNALPKNAEVRRAAPRARV